MSDNQHFSYADTLSSENPPGDSYEAKMAVAQIEATLALAYEQRTASLIALWAAPIGKTFPLSHQQADHLAEQIMERLGL